MLDRALIARPRLFLAALATTLVFTVSLPFAGSASAVGSSVAPSSAAPSSPSTGQRASNGNGAAAPSRATFGIAPATPGAVDNRSEFGYQLAATAHYDDHVALRNFSAQALKLTISAVDLGNDATGNIEAGRDQASAKDAGKWITLNHATTVIVPAQTSKGPGQVIIPFRITVPAEATPGDHAAEILGTLSTLSHDQNSANILLNQRIGTRVFIRVPGALKPGLAIRNMSASYHSGHGNPFGWGSAHVHYTVINSGNVALDVTQTAAIGGWFGASARVPANRTPELRQLLPGSSATFDYTVAAVPPAVIDKFSLVATSTFSQTATPLDQAANAQQSHLPVVRASVTFAALPIAITLAVVIVVLIVAGALFWRGRRRKGRRAVPPPDNEPEAKELEPTR